MPDKFKPLRLLAEDAEDLQVISAALQDAVGKIGDLAYEAKPRRFIAALNRFRWEAVEGARAERVRCALELRGVLAVKSKKLKRGASDAVVQLLAVTFTPGDAPGGAVTLAFAGGGELRLEVECVDALLADLSGPWPARRRPAHDDEGESA